MENEILENVDKEQSKKDTKKESQDKIIKIASKNTFSEKIKVTLEEPNSVSISRAAYGKKDSIKHKSYLFKKGEILEIDKDFYDELKSGKFGKNIKILEVK